jgi:hypothetical protein
VSSVGSADHFSWISNSGLDRLHFRPLEAPCGRLAQLLERGVGQFRRHRHLRAHPARDGAARTGGALHEGRHLVQADEFEDAPAEQEMVALLQARDEGLFHAADAPAAHVLDLDGGVRDDGADAHPVPPPDRHIGHAIDALLVRQHAPVFRIHGQALAAARDEIERPLPFFLGQVR